MSGGISHGSSRVIDHTECTAYLEISAVLGAYTYYGRTPASETRSTSAAIWQIWRVSATESTWADGNTLFDNVWDYRASLTYPGAVA